MNFWEKKARQRRRANKAIKMKVYYLTRDVYEGVIAFSHGFAMKQDTLYISKKGIIAQNPNNKEEFFYITDKGMIEVAEKIVKEKGKGYVGAFDVDSEEIMALISTGKEKRNADKEFNKKAKSLFELVNGGRGAGGCCG